MKERWQSSRIRPPSTSKSHERYYYIDKSDASFTRHAWWREQLANKASLRHLICHQWHEIAEAVCLEPRQNVMHSLLGNGRQDVSVRRAFKGNGKRCANKGVWIASKRLKSTSMQLKKINFNTFTVSCKTNYMYDMHFFLLNVQTTGVIFFFSSAHNSACSP